MASKEFSCPEHEEKLKLFCETDQKLICLICRDMETHQGHAFKPINEAAKCIKNEVNKALEFLSQDNLSLNSLLTLQTSESQKTKEKAAWLKVGIHVEFEEMRIFLKQREKDICKQLEKSKRRALAVIGANQRLIGAKLADGGEMQAVLRSAVDIKEPSHFLQWWSEKGYPVVKGLEKRNVKTRMGPMPTEYESNANNLWVTYDSLSMGPYETYLQFFMWKEMLGIIEEGPELLMLTDQGDPWLKVSAHGSSVGLAEIRDGFFFKASKPPKDYRGYAISRETFITGLHYFEVNVGWKPDWGVGIKSSQNQKQAASPAEEKLLILKHDRGYIFKDNSNESDLVLNVRPRKIGLYLNCDRDEVSFYNANNMTLIHSAKCDCSHPLVVCLSPGVYLDSLNFDPVTICLY